MSFLVWVVLIIVLVIILGFVLRILGGVAKSVVSLLVVALVIVGGGWIMLDINDLRQHFYQDDKLFVLVIDDQLVGAFVLGGDIIPKPVTDLAQLRVSYPNLAAMQGDHYKVIVLMWPVVAGDLKLGDFEASANELRAALRSGNPKQLFIDKALGQFGAGMLGQVTKEADRLYQTNDAFASTVFALLAEKPLTHTDRMLAGLKQGTVRIYPETVTFKILKVLPEGFGSIVLPTQGA